MPMMPKTNAMSSGLASAETSEGSIVASGPKMRIMIAIIIRPRASIPPSTEGLKTPSVRRAMPSRSATTNVLRMPSVRLLIPMLTRTAMPTTNSVPAVVVSAAGRRDVAVASASSVSAGVRLPARYSTFNRAASRLRMIEVSGKPMMPLQRGDQDGEDRHAGQADTEGRLLDQDDRDRSAAEGAGAGDDEVAGLGVAVLSRTRDAAAEDEAGDVQRDPDAEHRADADQERLPLLLEVVEADHRAEVDDDETHDDAGQCEQ